MTRKLLEQFCTLFIWCSIFGLTIFSLVAFG
jgi:hypothetical protein